jgi:hypothetical protein
MLIAEAKASGYDGAGNYRRESFRNPYQGISLCKRMVLGEKLFEETGNVTSFRVTKVHPVEGTTMEVSFVSDIKGIGKFPSGKNTGSGTMTQ